MTSSHFAGCQSSFRDFSPLSVGDGSEGTPTPVTKQCLSSIGTVLHILSIV